MLLEVRGVGLGRAHFLRRVHTHVLAAMTVIETAARLGPQVLASVRVAGVAAARAACHGEMVVAARHSDTRREMVFVDAVTGEDKPVEVEWRAAVPMQVIRARARPCGYLLAPNETEAIARLRLLGARLQPLAKARTIATERYVVTKEDAGRREDARGAIEDSEPMRAYEVRTERAHERLVAGTVYVPLDQPLAPLIEAALEPDSQNSFAANRVLAAGPASVRRVLRPLR
jgi:hypothetical protein